MELLSRYTGDTNLDVISRCDHAAIGLEVDWSGKIIRYIHLYTIMFSNLSSAPFCHSIKHDGTKSLATTRCTDQRDSLALCNLIPYKKPLPMEYRNFASLKGVRKEGQRYYGGSVELADFCPYNQEFEWKAVNSTDRRDSRCELPGNAPPEDANSVMEIYGPGSRCFDLDGSWTERKCGRTKTYSQFAAGCYSFFCRDGRLHIEVENSTTPHTCYYTGQRIRIRRIANGWLTDGTIRCPPCEDLCNKLEYWHSSNPNLKSPAPPSPNSTTCLPDDTVLGAIQDTIYESEAMDEPCFANHLRTSIALGFLCALVTISYGELQRLHQRY